MALGEVQAEETGNRREEIGKRKEELGNRIEERGLRSEVRGFREYRNKLQAGGGDQRSYD